MLSVLIICKQVDEYLMHAVKSVEALNPQILINISDAGEGLGVRKNRLIMRSLYEWVLILDTDEFVSKSLLDEINKVVNKAETGINAFLIPYQNYALGQRLSYGGEKFSKARLFRRSFGSVQLTDVHEEVVIEGKIGNLIGHIYHYSYRTIDQIITKFTKYAWQVAEEKRKAREQVTLKKLFLYGPHMVWARVIKDEGWRDGWRGIVIALCFGYMEALTYWLLLWRKLFG